MYSFHLLSLYVKNIPQLRFQSHDGSPVLLRQTGNNYNYNF